jgi:hypothetical protein
MNANQQFMRWLASYDPGVYSAVVRERARVGIGFLDVITGVVGIAGKYYADKKAKKEAEKAAREEKLQAARDNAERLRLISLNATRAASGQVPVNADGSPARVNYMPYLLVGGAAIAVALFIRSR